MKNKKIILAIIFLALISSLIVVIIVASINLTPIAIATAQARVKGIALSSINSAVSQAMKNFSYEDLINVVYDQNGKISMLSANSVKMNQISSNIGILAGQYISDIELQPIRIAIGSLLGNPLFVGKGPSFLVKAVPTGTVASEFITEFEDAGINQTRHKISIKVIANMKILVPTGSDSVEIVSFIPVCETIIVGQVPSSFVEVESTDDMLNLLPEIE